MMCLNSLVFLVLLGGVVGEDLSLWDDNTCRYKCRELYSDMDEQLDCLVTHCFRCTVSDKRAKGKYCSQTFKNAQTPEPVIVLNKSCNYEQCEVACRKHMLTHTSSKDHWKMKYRTCCIFNATSEQCVYHDIRSGEGTIVPEDPDTYAWTTKRCGFYTDISEDGEAILDHLDPIQPEETPIEGFDNLENTIKVRGDTTCRSECHKNNPDLEDALNCLVDNCFHCTVDKDFAAGKYCSQTFKNAVTPEPVVVLDGCCNHEECEVACRRHMLKLNSGKDTYIIKYRTCCEYKAESKQCIYRDIRSGEGTIVPREENMENFAWTTKRCAWYSDVSVAEDETKLDLDEFQPVEVENVV